MLTSSSVDSYHSTNSTSASRTQTNASASNNQIPRDAPPEISEISSQMGQLQDLQQSDPEKYKELVAKIATKLRDTASTASENGDSQKAAGLNDLATKFQTASQTGQMVDLKPPEGAGPQGPPPDEDSDSSSASSSSSKYSEFQSMMKQDSGNDPMSILSDTLSTLLDS